MPYGMCLTKEQHQSVDNERCDNRYGIEGLVNGFTGGQGNNKREEVERATGVCCQADETDKELIDCDDDGTTYQITVDIIQKGSISWFKKMFCDPVILSDPVILRDPAIFCQ